MSVLGWIILASLLGGVLSVAAAAVFAFNARTAHVPILISFAVGALLGAVFLDILPHAFRMTESPERIAATILFGILIFFVLEVNIRLDLFPGEVDYAKRAKGCFKWATADEPNLAEVGVILRLLEQQTGK